MFPQALLIKTAATLQNEKVIPAYFREKTVLKCYNNNIMPANFIPLNKAGLKHFIYIGCYIDPPDLA